MPSEQNRVNVNGPLSSGGFAASASTRRPAVAFYPRSVIGNLKDLFGTSQRLLEVEPATGILTGQLLRAGMNVTVCEGRPEFQLHLKRTLPGLHILSADELITIANEDQFDVVIKGVRELDGDVTPIDHLSHLKTIAAAGQVLRPGGAWVVIQHGVAELLIEYARS